MVVLFIIQMTGPLANVNSGSTTCRPTKPLMKRRRMGGKARVKSLLQAFDRWPTLRIDGYIDHSAFRQAGIEHL